MEKECEICGVFFETKYAIQKYCPDCGKHAEYKRKKMNRNIQISVSRCGTGKKVEPIMNTCNYCGCEFESWIHKKDFCSESCKEKWIRENTSCDYCGKAYLETENPDAITAGRWFCSYTCKEAYKRKEAEEKGFLRTCKFCGKEFIKRDGIFCNRECYQNAVRDGWKPSIPANQSRPKYCKNCGKEDPFEDGLCSEKCRVEFARKETLRLQDEQRQIKKMKPLSKAKKTSVKKTASAKETSNGLCASCRTPYTQCERMSSGFSRLPDGAVKEGNIIVRCPKYTEKKTRTSSKKIKETADRLSQEYIEKNGLCSVCRTPYAQCERMSSNFTYSPKGTSFKGSLVVKCPKFVR